MATVDVLSRQGWTIVGELKGNCALGVALREEGSGFVELRKFYRTGSELVPCSDRRVLQVPLRDLSALIEKPKDFEEANIE